MEGPGTVEDKWKLSSTTTQTQPVPIEKFRLLIIGKSGCGKTTILSKVCGEEVADKPSTTRGTHNIEREMEFKTNSRFVVHDSEGFEAGQEDEYRVVANFIESRGRQRDINERLHAIWYCLTTSSRPIQQAEERFFSQKHDVPVVAIFTKFDLFVENQLQDLMEEVEEDIDEELENALERQAESKALEKFNHHFKGVLLSKPYPPSAVVALSDVNSSTLKDTRLGELIKETMVALKVDGLAGSEEEQELSRRLASLFSAAQQADLITKYKICVQEGTPYVLNETNARYHSRIMRPRITLYWKQMWQRDDNLLAAFETNVVNHPTTLGNSSEAVWRKNKLLPSIEIEAYRCLQLVMNLTIIMAQLFLLNVEDKKTGINIIEKYITTTAFSYTQKQTLELDISSVRTEEKGGGFMLFEPAMQDSCKDIIDKAVRLLLVEE